MQPAVSMSSRGLLAAALLLSVALFVPAATALSSTVVVSAEPVGSAEPIGARTAVPIDTDWEHANDLASAIKHRRYGEIEAAAAQIARSSPYARWVPTAIALAIEQLDTTADAYAQMGRCSELGAFLRRIGEAWPAGRAAMRTHACGSFMCKTYRTELTKALGGVAAYRAVQQVLAGERYTERILEIDQAIRIGDHAGALASCADTRYDGPVPSMCLSVACRAGELAIAEVLLPYGDDVARAACADVGVTFARDIAVASGAWRTHPADLVHVHPDAPAEAD